MLPGQVALLQTSKSFENPVQFLPPWACLISMVLDRVLIPSPHDFEHPDQFSYSLHLQSIGRAEVTENQHKIN